MVKLSDYLNYLYQEVVKARKNSDLFAIQMAKEYAAHEYLKLLKVPRYIMPTVHLELPIKVSELDADVKYDFRMDLPTFLHNINLDIANLNNAKQYAIPTITEKDVNQKNFTSIIKKLESSDQKLVKNKEQVINNFNTILPLSSIKKLDLFVASKNDPEIEEALQTIMRNRLLEMYIPVSARLNNIFIDPHASQGVSKDLLSLQLKVLMQEEGIQITTTTAENGDVIEQIIID